MIAVLDSGPVEVHLDEELDALKYMDQNRFGGNGGEGSVGTACLQSANHCSRRRTSERKRAQGDMVTPAQDLYNAISSNTRGQGRRVRRVAPGFPVL